MSVKTEADNRAILLMPNGWFEAERLPYLVRCPRARCQRLEKMGVLESRVVGEHPFELHTEFRKRTDINAVRKQEGEA